MTIRDAHDTALIDHAATVLAGAAQARDVSSGVALLCLSASERLAVLVGHAVPARRDVVSVEAAITSALTALGELSPETFANSDVLDAASDARRALELVT